MNRRVLLTSIFLFPLLNMLFSSSLRAESGAEAWLRYAPLDSKAAHQFDTLPSTVVSFDGSEILTSARDELVRGIRGILGRTLLVSTQTSSQRAVLFGTISALQHAIPNLRPGSPLSRSAAAKISSSPPPATAASFTAFSLFSTKSRAANRLLISTSSSDPMLPFVGSISGTISMAASNAVTPAVLSFSKTGTCAPIYRVLLLTLASLLQSASTAAPSTT